MRQTIVCKHSITLFGHVIGVGFDFADDGIWETKFQREVWGDTSDKRDYTYTDFICFGMIKRSGDEDITLYRLIFGPFQVVIGFT